MLDGIALSQPALALAAKILDRAGRAGLDVPPPLPAGRRRGRLGASLLAAVAEARAGRPGRRGRPAPGRPGYAEAVRAAEADAGRPEPIMSCGVASAGRTS